MRVAFYGRVSTDDAQDPSLSIPRQLAKCEQVLESISEKVTVTFWDVESGRKALEQRGKGSEIGRLRSRCRATAASLSYWRASRRERSTW